MRKHGLIAPWAIRVSFFLYLRISPYRIVEKLFDKKKKWRKVRENWRIDVFVLSAFCIELIFLVTLSFLIHPFGYALIFIIPALLLLFWRLLNILGAWLWVFITSTYRGVSPKRTLFLTIINYFEIVAIFAFFAFVFKYGFFDSLASAYSTFPTVLESVRYSIGIVTTIGSRYEPYTCLGYFLFILQIFFGLLFLAVIVQRALSYFRQGRKECSNSEY